MSLLNISRDKMLGQALPSHPCALADRNRFRALLIGTYVNSFLYIQEVIEVIKYFRHFAYRDRFFVQAVVFLALVIDSLDTAATDGIVYLNTITHWGDEAYFEAGSLIVPIFLILTSVSAIISRIYLSLRYWRITKNRIPSILLILSNLSFVAGTALLAVTMFNNPSFDVRAKLRTPAIFWMAASTASDVVIAIALLVVSRRGIFPSYGLSSYYSFSFPRFCSVMLQAGVIGAAFSIAALIVFSLDTQETNLSFAISISLGRIYTHAILRNLNSRDPKPLDDRKSLPHTIQLASYPFMPSTPGTALSAEISKEIGLNGSRPLISAPVLVEDPTPENLMAGITLLKHEWWGGRGSESTGGSKFLE
ncbi:hypothetical protein B0H19DRAFT_1247522 [Mycena capillaripes]|nr:hypothetical protein B0H19DRAFT_1247522 [Mycena capillaripes]